MSKLPELQRKPLSFGMTMLASALGIVIVSIVCSIIMFFFTIAMMVSIASMGGDGDKVMVRSDSFLSVSLDNISGDRTNGVFQSLFDNGNSVGLIDAATAIRKAADDPCINGLYIEDPMVSDLSWGSIKELRDAVVDFRKSGKPVLTYATNYSQEGYYLASAADMVCLHPAGMVDFRGIGGMPMFYKELLDKLDVEMELIRPESCAFKSAGETYTMNHMSDANRKQVHTYINSIWNTVTADIAKSRTDLTVAQLNAIADNLSGYLASDARQSLLVDSLCFEQDVRQMMKEDYDAEQLVSIGKYAKKVKQQRNKSADEIAVIYAEGNVLDGESRGMDRAVYGDDLVKAFADAADDDDVKAIVLRVNSPGGSATASEAMTHAIMLAKERKPVIVSMGDLAASAGYEISCNADVIVAQPTTITGSIGVFATIPYIGKMMKNKLGITTDTVMTNRNSTGLSTMRPRSKEATAIMHRQVEDFYKVFVGRVARGRGMTEEQVHDIARGRVWTGADAVTIGLVDTLGGFDLAMRIAAEKAGLKDYKVKEYPASDDPWEQLSKMFGGSDDDIDLMAKARLAWEYRLSKKRMPKALTRLEEDIQYISSAEGVQARIPFVLLDE